MSWVVKWKLRRGKEALQSREAYAVPSEAIDFVGTIFKQHPAEIWIEGPGRVRIERDAIFRQCQDRGSLRP